MPSQFLLILPYVATIIAVAGLCRPGQTHRRPTRIPLRSSSCVRRSLLEECEICRIVSLCEGQSPSTGTDRYASAARRRAPAATRTRRTRTFRWVLPRLVDDGRVVTGCNVENASLRRGPCALECGLVSALHAQLAAGDWSRWPASMEAGAILMPCGRCRQPLWEHRGAECLVDDPPPACCRWQRVLPQAFGPDDLARSRSRALTLEALQAFLKVSLHDHLDGGLRPQTIIELAADAGHVLPADNADDLGRWFAESADSGSLVRYLTTFDQTIAVLQTAPSLRRVAAEFVEDLAADGVIYGEARWAPEGSI